MTAKGKKIMDIRLILKKKILCSLATKYLKKEFKNLDERNLTEQQVNETRLYFTSKIAQQPFTRVNGKIVWSKDEHLASSYQRQVVEIAKLDRNIKKLDKLRHSSKISDYTREVVEKYLMNLKRARKIYGLGKDDINFDYTVADMNDFVKTHTVYKNGHKTFRLTRSKEREVQQFGHTMIKNHREMLLNETRKKFDNIIENEKTK